MTSLSKKTLDDITDEVKEFHPLLETLLPKLPHVIRVEYTHGINEFGADFVISKSDDIFGDEYYIGVIAKVAKITQDFSDIERQIDECSLARTFMGGKRKINLEEVWVITTKSISNNAQTKIHEKYKLHKIFFIDGIRLATLIDQYVPSYWTKLPIKLAEYLVTIKTRNEEIDRTVSLIPIKDKSY